MLDRKDMPISRRKTRKLRELVVGKGPEARIFEFGMEYRAAEGAAEDIPILEYDPDYLAYVGENHTLKSSVFILARKMGQEATALAQAAGMNDSKMGRLFFDQDYVLPDDEK